MSEIEDLEEFRRKVRERREQDWVRDAIRLRKRTPEESLRAMFDLIRFAVEVARARKCEP